jgi:hypothetical protein
MHSICFNKLITLVFLYFLVLFCLVSTFQFLLVSFETITGSIIRIRLSNLASISLRKKNAIRDGFLCRLFHCFTSRPDE